MKDVSDYNAVTDIRFSNSMCESGKMEIIAPVPGCEASVYDVSDVCGSMAQSSEDPSSIWSYST